MPFDKFLIAPLKTGLQRDMKPWMIQDDAFEFLQNAYVWRGRVIKRFGSYLVNATGAATDQFNARLRISLGSTNGSGNFSGTAKGAIFQVGQMFSIGTASFTVIATGAPANLLRSDGVVATATFNTTTGAVVINGAAAATVVFFYPSTPVMGFTIYQEGPINDEPTFAFDQQFAYQQTGGGWDVLGLATWTVLTGSDSQFIWAANYRNALGDATLLFITNNNPADPMQYWDGAAWHVFNPAVNAAGDKVKTCLMIIPFKDRLLLFNTTETGASAGTYVNRMRYSQNGDPTAATAFYDQPTTTGFGGFLSNYDTQEAIISARTIKDRLIVFFENSTYELVYTANEIQPYRWQRINTELGTQSTFSTVPFDKVILTVGNVGVHACNGSNVERIDSIIPEIIFEVSEDNNGIRRVHGVRDYFKELVYWTYPSAEGVIDDVNDTYPNQILVYNYKTGSWALNNDSITAFGYYLQQPSLTWATWFEPWEESDWSWNSPSTNQQFREIIAGNQEGFTFIIDDELTRNASALQITNITAVAGAVTITAINHNIEDGSYVIIENLQATDPYFATLNGNIYEVDVLNANIFTIYQPGAPASGYLGQGTLALVSNITIQTKQFNPYSTDAGNFYLYKVEFNVDATPFNTIANPGAQITVNYGANFSDDLSLLNDAQATGTILGTGILDTYPYALVPNESVADQLWHPVYFQTTGPAIQLILEFSDTQIRNPVIAFADFELNAMLLFTQRSGRLQ